MTPGRCIRSAAVVATLGLALLGGVTGAAAAEPGAPRPTAQQQRLEAEATKRARLAREAYLKGDYAAASALYLAAKQLVPKPVYDYNLGLCQDKLDRGLDAVRSFRRFLASSPAEAWAKPAREAIARLLLKVLVEVSVTSYPPGAAVRVGGPKAPIRGRTPAKIELRPGRHVLWVEAAGHESERREVDVDVGEAINQDFQLRRQSSLQVATSVAGARVAIDTDDPARAELAPVQQVVKPGRHTILVQKQGYDTVRRVVEIQPGEQASVFVDLKLAPQYGLLRVRCNVVGATVQVESEEVGETPLVDYRLLVGTYRVYVRRPGYRSWERRVTLLADQVTTITVQLNRTTSRRQMGWLIAGSSATGLLVASGLILTLTAVNARQEYDDLPTASLRVQGRRLALAADALIASGVLAAAITGFLAWRLRPAPSSGEIFVAPTVGPGVAGLSVGGTF
jgi:hypothetical protein